MSSAPKTAKAETKEVEIDTTGEDIAVSVKVTSEWDHHYNADVTITNLSGEQIENWEICFPLADTIENIWNAKIISNEDGEYIIRNADWNQDILSEQSVSFGMTVAYEDEISYPDYCYLTRDLLRVRDSYEVTYTENSRWDGHVNGMITITNTGSHRIEDWSMIMECNLEFENIWNANIIEYYEDYDCFDIGNAGYNQNIEPGQSVQFGFIAKCSGEVTIGEYTLYEMAEMDYDDDEFSDEEDYDEELVKDADYFDTYEEYEAYFYERNGWRKRSVKSMLRSVATKPVTATPISTLDFGWDITAAQNYLPLNDGSIYTLHIAKDKEKDKKMPSDVWINKGRKGGNGYEDFLTNPNVMSNFAHGQTFEQFVYKGTEYYLLSGNPRKVKNSSEDENRFSRDIIFMSPERLKEIAEEPNKLVKFKYDDLFKAGAFKKLTNAECANKAAKAVKSSGPLARVDAAVTSDSSTLVVWSKMNLGKMQLALYDMKKICKKFYGKRNQKNKLSFANLKDACIASCTDTKTNEISNAMQPGGSFQSVDVKKNSDGTCDVYITSGNEAKNKRLYISCITLKKGKNKSPKHNIVEVDLTTDKYSEYKELEGCHVAGNSLNFLVAPAGKKVSKQKQYIYSVPLSDIKG